MYERSRNVGRANAGYQDPNNCDLAGANLLTCTPQPQYQHRCHLW